MRREGDERLVDEFEAERAAHDGDDLQFANGKRELFAEADIRYEFSDTTGAGGGAYALGLTASSIRTSRKTPRCRKWLRAQTQTCR